MSDELPPEVQGKLIVFGGKHIRRIWHDDEWYFSIVDIVGALTDSGAPSKYWAAMKRREQSASGIQLSTFCRQLRLTAADGKSYKTDCVNTEAAFRIIQSIPSAKAESFKRWLAEIGHQRIQEIEDPELAQERMRQLYRETRAVPSKPNRDRKSSRAPTFSAADLNRICLVRPSRNDLPAWRASRAFRILDFELRIDRQRANLVLPSCIKSKIENPQCCREPRMRRQNLVLCQL